MGKEILDNLLRLGLKTEPHNIIRKGHNASIAGLFKSGGPILGASVFTGMRQLRKATGASSKAVFNRRTRSIHTVLHNIEPYDAQINAGASVLTNNGAAARKTSLDMPEAFEGLENLNHGKL